MTRPASYLYDLLPTVYRMRDAEQGYPLRELLEVVTEQVNVVEEDIAQLYDNWFIETCEDWVVPYLGDLVGYRPVHEAGAPADPAAGSGAGRNKVLVPRRDVANTVGFRRRKGTLALLEVLANAVSGWPARAVEFSTLLGWAQHLDHQRLARGRYVDLRSTEVLDRLDLPFDQIAHRVDLRRTVSHHAPGRHNIPSVGVFVWRLGSYPITRAPAFCLEREGSHCYTFSVLGNDTPLFTLPEREADPTHIAEELNVPTPIRLRAFEHRLSEHPLVSEASPDYYGKDRSLSIEVEDWPKKGRSGVVRAEDVVPADLTDWHAYAAPRGKVLVDPALGRLVFAKGQSPKHTYVSYHYGFSADLGGGEYARTVSQPPGARLYRVRQQGTRPGEFATINDAYVQWGQDKALPDLEADGRPHAAVIEIRDSGVYEERLGFELEAFESLQLRAAPRTRPVLRLLDYRVDQPDSFSVTGRRGSRFVLDGVLVTGRGIEIAGPGSSDEESTKGGSSEESTAGGSSDKESTTGASSEESTTGAGGQPDDDFCDVTIRHCTLVPGWGLERDCKPDEPPHEPSLTLNNTRARIVIEHSILGSIVANLGEKAGEPLLLRVSDSILDATSEAGVALSSGDGRMAFASVTMVRSTVIGEVMVHAMELAENSVFVSPVRVARRQVGCVRYCYVPPGSRTPRRYRCQPDVVVQDVADDLRDQAARAGQPVDLGALGLAQDRERDRVSPVFESTRYGRPDYVQLAEVCAAEIRRGADDESEVGAFHDLFQPQRAANLRARLDEYTPAGMDAGIFYAS